MLLTMLSWYWQWHSDETGVEIPTQWLIAVRITDKSPIGQTNHRQRQVKHCQITVTMLLTMLLGSLQWHSDRTGVEMPTKTPIDQANHRQRQANHRQITVNDTQITVKSPSQRCWQCCRGSGSNTVTE
jgi:hypothetical protein